MAVGHGGEHDARAGQQQRPEAEQHVLHLPRGRFGGTADRALEVARHGLAPQEAEQAATLGQQDATSSIEGSQLLVDLPQAGGVRPGERQPARAAGQGPGQRRGAVGAAHRGDHVSSVSRNGRGVVSGPTQPRPEVAAR